MVPRAITVFAFGLISAYSAADEYAELLDMPLEQLLQITVNVAGETVHNIGLDRVPVTDNPLATPHFSIPVTVEMVTDRTIEARGFRNVVDVVHSMTGVIVGETPSEPYSFGMRGFSRGEIGVLYDGVSMGSSNLNMRPIGTNNLHRVELLKGPVALQGGGAAGGTINIVPRRASVQPRSLKRLYASYGSYQSSAISLDVEAPLNQKSGYLLDLDIRKLGGWVDNSDSHSFNANGSINIQLLPDLTLLLSADYFTDKLPGYWGTPLVPAGVAKEPEQVVSTDNQRVIDGTTKYNNYNVSDHKIDSKSGWLKASLNWQMPEDIKSYLSLYLHKAKRHWRNAESYSYIESNGRVERDRLLVDHDREIVGLQGGVTLSGEWLSRPNRFSLNWELSDNRFDRNVGFEPEFFIVDEVDFRNPEPGEFYVDGIDVRPDVFDESRLALILDDALEMSDKWHLTLGLKTEHIRFTRERYNFNGSINTDQSDDLFQLSYKLGVGYAINSQWNLYGHYAFGHETTYSGLVVYGTDDLIAFELPEVSQMEVGVKFRNHSGHLQFTAALYSIEKKALQNKNAVNQKLLQTSEGFELSLSSYLSENIKLGANLAYNLAEFSEYYDFTLGQDVSGNQPINAPKSISSIWLSVDKIAHLPIEIGANINYVSERYSTVSNDVRYEPYHVLNAFVAYTGSQYRIALHVRNIFDELYVPFSEPFYVDQVSLGPPRTAEVSLRVAL